MVIRKITNAKGLHAMIFLVNVGLSNICFQLIKPLPYPLLKWEKEKEPFYKGTLQLSRYSQYIRVLCYKEKSISAKDRGVFWNWHLSYNLVVIYNHLFWPSCNRHSPTIKTSSKFVHHEVKWAKYEYDFSTIKDLI